MYSSVSLADNFSDCYFLVWCRYVCAHLALQIVFRLLNQIPKFYGIWIFTHFLSKLLVKTDLSPGIRLFLPFLNNSTLELSNKSLIPLIPLHSKKLFDINGLRCIR